MNLITVFAVRTVARRELGVRAVGTLSRPVHGAGTHALRRLWQGQTPRPATHVYTLLVVMFGWVLFRADTLSHALLFFKTMFHFNAADLANHPLGRYVSRRVLCAIALGVVFAAPTWPWFKSWLANFPRASPSNADSFAHARRDGGNHLARRVCSFPPRGLRAAI